MKRGLFTAALSLGLIVVAMALSSCQSARVEDQAMAVSREGKTYKRGLYTRPQPKPRTQGQEKNAPKINQRVLSQSTKGNTRFVVDIAAQRGYLLVDGKIGLDTPVSTGRPGKHTPRGTFSMTQRVRAGKVSTIYGVEMPYWMRLGGTVYGVHAGYLPGYPASAGCIRLPVSAAEVVFNHTTTGTKVTIYNSWDGARLAAR